MISTTFQNKTIKNKRLLVFVSVLIWGVIWHASSLAINRPLLLPSPLEVFARIYALIKSPFFWQISFISLWRILSGFIWGVLLGIFLSALSHKIYPLRIFVSPVISVLRATPVASFIILVWSFTGSERLPVFISAIMVLPLVYENMLTGLDGVKAELKEVAWVYDFSLKDKLNALYLPEIMPYFTSALTASLGLAWKAGIAAEVLAYTASSIGRELYRAKSTLEINDLFAWTIWIILLSIALEYVAKQILKLFTRRRKNAFYRSE